MAVPKRKTSKSRRNKRRSHHKVKSMNIIKDYMSTPVLSIDVNASVEETAKEMLEKGVSCLLVREKESFVGVITEKDLVHRVMAKERDAKNTRTR